MLNHENGNFLDLTDARLYYEETGSPQGHPLILLHGGLGSIEDFFPVIGVLPDSFRIIAVDMRGHGRSSAGTRPLTYQQHQADIQALIAHLGLVQYSLAGFSDGGIVAYRIAENNPSVRALVTIGARWRISPESPSFAILNSVTAEGWSAMFPDAPGKYAALNPNGDFSTLVRSCVSLWTDLSASGCPQDAIAEITCPTLILRGDGDFLLSLEEAAEAQSRIAGSSFGNIPYARHAAIADSPIVTGTMIHDFIMNPVRLPTAPE